MAEKGHHGYAETDEERRHERGREGGHASEERGTAHEFNPGGGDAGRRGGQTTAHGATGGASNAGDDIEGDDADETSSRTRKTRGGTHDQHVTAGKKGGNRIRQLIELGYKYEQEHGIGPGQNERSKLAAKRRAGKSGSAEGGE
jgi:hypothetical protein